MRQVFTAFTDLFDSSVGVFVSHGIFGIRLSVSTGEDRTDLGEYRTHQDAAAAIVKDIVQSLTAR